MVLTSFFSLMSLFFISSFIQTFLLLPLLFLTPPQVPHLSVGVASVSTLRTVMSQEESDPDL